MKTNKVKTIPAAIQSELGIESITIDAATLIHEYDLATYAIDDAALAVYTAGRGMVSILEKLVKAGYTSLQSGHTKAKKLKAGEFPYLVAAEEFKTNYLARHEKLWNEHQNTLEPENRLGWSAPADIDVKNVVKQKISTMSFFLDSGKYTTNVGKDKPRLMYEIYNEKWLNLLQDKKAAEASATRAAGIAAESKKRASEIQAAVILAQNTPSTPAAVVCKVETLSKETLQVAEVDAIAAAAAQNLLGDIAAEVADLEEKKNAAAAAAEVKKTKGKKAPSVATDADGKTNHDASTVISKDATIGRDSALKVKKAIAAIVDNMSLIEVREVYRGLGLVLLDAKMEL